MTNEIFKRVPEIYEQENITLVYKKVHTLYTSFRLKDNSPIFFRNIMNE